MVCNVSRHAFPVLPYWAWFALLLFSHWYIIAGHGLHCFTSFFTGSYLLAMAGIVSFDAALVATYLAWFVLFHFMLHWFIIAEHDWYCFI
jgi:hypothetical protein